MESDDLNDHLPYSYKEDLISRFGTGEELGILQNSEIFAREPLFMAEDDASTSLDGTKDSEDSDDVIILHMDIREPIRKLRLLLEQKIGVDLNRYEFWLQDAQMLEPHKNLVDQCVKGEGLVQINLQVRTDSRKINIVDVLKPTDEALAELGHLSDERTTEINVSELPVSKNEPPHDIDEPVATVDPTDLLELSEPSETNEPIDISDKVTTELIEDTEISVKKEPAKWVIDTNFKKDLARLRISDDPKEWTVAQVRHWLQWAVRQFNLSHIKLQDWSITGKELTNLTIEEFRQKVPLDPEDLFWTHFELLRKCKMVAVRGQSSDDEDDDQALFRKAPKIGGNKSVKLLKSYSDPISQYDVVNTSQGNRTGNNGQIQLWQFLLEILTDREHVNIIQWIGGQGEFKLKHPERVAQLWGIRKNKLTMNYEKLSRALRYYYDGDMISKVHNKRFVYKFVCDLTQLIGYSAQELSNFVNQGNPNAISICDEML